MSGSPKVMSTRGPLHCVDITSPCPHWSVYHHEGDHNGPREDHNGQRDDHNGPRVDHNGPREDHNGSS